MGRFKERKMGYLKDKLMAENMARDMNTNQCPALPIMPRQDGLVKAPQKAEKESFLDGDSRENDKAMALLKSLLVKVAIQRKQKVEGLNIIQSFPEEALVQNQVQFRAQKALH